MSNNNEPWVVYDDGLHIYAESPTKGGASRKRRTLSAKYPERHFSQATRSYFDANIDHDVQVQSLMGGKLVTIKASQRGGCCDPSTETYWSM